MSTTENVIDKLFSEAGRPMTYEETLEQKVSFVMGTIEGMDRERVREMIEEREGRPS